MARVAIVAGYLAGHPVGGHVLSILHWLAGLRGLGYDVVFAEHHGWSDACWNPLSKTLSDDASYGIGELKAHAELIGLRGWCFVDVHGVYHGLSRSEMVAFCRAADVMLGLWTVTWLDEFAECRRRIFIDTRLIRFRPFFNVTSSTMSLLACRASLAYTRCAGPSISTNTCSSWRAHRAARPRLSRSRRL